MLSITIPSTTLFLESTSEFVTVKECTLHLEHSLLSISKWEAKWEKPFLSEKEKTNEEVLDYVQCMIIDKNYDPMAIYAMRREHFSKIEEYINAKMSATWFSDAIKRSSSRKIITSEVIYYWMTAYNIPFECQKWHLNRLLNLIQICSEESQPKKKMSKSKILRDNYSLNAARLAASRLKG